MPDQIDRNILTQLMRDATLPIAQLADRGRISRIHGPFVSDEEVEEIVAHLKSFGPPVYMSGVTQGPEDEAATEIDSILELDPHFHNNTVYLGKNGIYYSSVSNP